LPNKTAFKYFLKEQLLQLLFLIFQTFLDSLNFVIPALKFVTASRFLPHIVRTSRAERLNKIKEAKEKRQ
jgi:hypothetical protein